MSITIKYFGAVAEQAGRSTESITIKEDGIDLADLKAFCFKKYNISDFGTIQTAINRVVRETGLLKSGDEVAFLPPFAGG